MESAPQSGTDDITTLRFDRWVDRLIDQSKRNPLLWMDRLRSTARVRVVEPADPDVLVAALLEGNMLDVAARGPWVGSDAAHADETLGPEDGPDRVSERRSDALVYDTRRARQPTTRLDAGSAMPERAAALEAAATAYSDEYGAGAAPGRRSPADTSSKVVLDFATEQELVATLTKLRTRARKEFNDKGIWSLFLAIGQLWWTARDEKGAITPARSPLLLVPIEIDLRGGVRPTLKAREGGAPILNPALVSRLERDHGIQLPDYVDAESDTDGTGAGSAQQLSPRLPVSAPGDDEAAVGVATNGLSPAIPISQYLANVEEVVRRWNYTSDWHVDRHSYIARLQYHKQAIHDDLRKNRELALAHPIVDALVGRTAVESHNFEEVDERRVDDEIPPEKLVSILDADASQRKCIKAAIDGRSFVIDGPPGTGKSQTITNIIAELIYRGKSVLFVSEKIAALEVVSKRLADKGLDEFILTLHDPNARASDIARAVEQAIRSDEGPTPTSSDRKAKRLREELTQWADAVHERREPLGMSLYDALGEAARELAHDERLRNGSLHPPGWRGEPADLTRDHYEEIMDLAARLEQYWAPVTQEETFSWRDVAFTALTNERRYEIRTTLERFREVTRLLAHEVRQLLSQLGITVVDAGANLGERTTDIPIVLGLCQLLDERPSAVTRALLAKNQALVRTMIDEVSDLWAQVRAAQEDLASDFGSWWETVPETTLLSLSDSLAGADRLAPQWALRDSVTAADIEAVRDTVQRIATRGERVIREAMALAEALRTARPANLQDLDQLCELVLLLTDPDGPPLEWLHPSTLARLQGAVGEIVSCGRRAAALREEVGATFEESALTLDLEGIAERYRTRYRKPWRVLKGSYRADRRILAQHTKRRRVDSMVERQLARAGEWQQLMREFSQLQEKYRATVGDVALEVAVLDGLERRAQAAGRILELARELARGTVASGVVSLLRSRSDAQNFELAQRAQTLRTEARSWIDNCQGPISDDALHWLVHESLEQIVATAPDAHKLLDAVHRAMGDVARHSPRPMVLGEARRLASGWKTRTERVAKISQFEDHLRDAFPTHYRGDATAWHELRDAVAWCDRVAQQLSRVGESLPPTLGEVHIDAASLRDRAAEYQRLHDTIASWFVADRRERMATQLQGVWENVDAVAGDLATHMDQIDVWLEFARCREKLADFGLREVVDEAIRERLPAADVQRWIRWSLVDQWIEWVLESDDRLRKWKRADREDCVARFRDADEQLINSAAAKVWQRCADSRAKAVRLLPGERSIVETYARRRRRQGPARRLFEAAGRIIRETKPCLMMSPLAVSTLLPPTFQADVVIFDEASQVPPEEALNCIYRGKALIVAGDEKQLPPTSFFSKQEILDEDDEEWDDDLESIIAVCKSAGFPSLSLRWHYRSRHESLIAFSNRAFYNDRLITFPSPVRTSTDLGIGFYKVEGGQYVHQVNRLEAVAVAKRIMEYADRVTSGREAVSVGVVTFSEAQEEAVEQALYELRRERGGATERFFDDDRLSGFFIKNLEDVQGDERDVIIFSVGYGPGPEGRVDGRMGPLSRTNGWRRLNVAITRARKRVEIYCSMDPEQIPSTVAPEGGVARLREYLEYARAGGTWQARGGKPGRYESAFEEAVARTIEGWGYTVIPQVGMSSYRIDLGVVDPKDESMFILGIECDGPRYHRHRVARDRDRLRQRQLEALGWRLYRIWGTAWCRHRDEEIRRLREAIAEAERDSQRIPRVAAKAIRPDGGQPTSSVSLPLRRMSEESVGAAPAPGQDSEVGPTDQVSELPLVREALEKERTDSAGTDVPSQPSTQDVGLPRDIGQVVLPDYMEELDRKIEWERAMLQRLDAGGSKDFGERARARERLLKLLRERGSLIVSEYPRVADRVRLGSWVLLQLDDDEPNWYQLVPPRQEDSGRGRLSVTTPVGRAIFAAAAGDIVPNPRGGSIRVLEIRIDDDTAHRRRYSRGRP